MKQLVGETGGRPVNNDDFFVLQQELTDAIQAQFLGKGPFILSGCVVSGSGPAYNISAGIVCLDGQLLRFAGAGAVTLPAQLQAGAAVVSDPRPYQTGGTKNCMREVPAVLVDADATYTGGEFLPLDTWSGKRWADIMRASIRSLKELQTLAEINPADYEGGFSPTTGLGKPGTEAWGWALCNGNNGTKDMRGMFARVANDARANDGRGHQLTLTAAGSGGGQESVTLTTSNLPPNPSGTLDVATFVGAGAGKNLTTEGTNGWTGRQPTAGIGEAIGILPPHENVPMRQWVGY